MQIVHPHDLFRNFVHHDALQFVELLEFFVELALHFPIMSFDKNLLHSLTHIAPEAENAIGVLFYSGLSIVLLLLLIVIIRGQGFQDVIIRVNTLHVLRERDRLLDLDVIRENACAPLSFSILAFFHACMVDLNALLSLLLPHLLVELGFEFLNHSEEFDMPDAVLLASF